MYDKFYRACFVFCNKSHSSVFLNKFTINLTWKPIAFQLSEIRNQDNSYICYLSELKIHHRDYHRDYQVKFNDIV